jgi:uncharacterized protein (DUF2236 family)
VSPVRRRGDRGIQGRSHAERLASTDGYFAPGSVIRQVGSTPVTPLLGGGTAVLLQVAHPLVAAGVAEHSAFEGDLWRRLLRTVGALYTITFGSKAEADQAGAVVRAVHARVTGTTPTDLGAFPAGTPYSANDPKLMLWVHATLVYASLSAYQRFVRKLTPDERNSYYADMTTVARIFGTPAELLPPTLDQFHDYFAATLAGDEIAVTKPARAIAGMILRAPLPVPMRLLAPAHRLATAGQLPPHIRREYGLRWTPLHGPVLAAAADSVRLGSCPILRVAARLGPAVPALVPSS